MATYAIGDIQGCYAPLRRMLKRIRFDPKVDRLWIVGDLVNRGPQNLDVLRWATDQGDRLSVVLGNHDVHLLARYEGVSEPKKRDTLDDVLEAKDANELIRWLSQQPLVHREGDVAMVHAALLPDWTWSDAAALAAEVSAALRKERKRALEDALQPPPLLFRDASSAKRRLQLALAAFTRLRICARDGEMRLDFSGSAGDIPDGCVPWFELPHARGEELTVVFGHWAALGLYVSRRVIGLDSGCVWGSQLTALRLEDRKLFQESCAG